MKITIKELKTLIKSVINEQKINENAYPEDYKPGRRYEKPSVKRYPYDFNYKVEINNKVFHVEGKVLDMETADYEKMIMFDEKHPNGIDILYIYYNSMNFSSPTQQRDEKKFEILIGNPDDFQWDLLEKVEEQWQKGYDEWEWWH